MTLKLNIVFLQVLAKIVDFQMWKSIKNHQYYEKIKGNEVANFVPYISSWINFGHLMTWSINIIILGDFDHLQERHTRSIFIIFLAQSNWWYIYLNGKKIYLEMISFKTYKRIFSVDCSIQFWRKNICNNFLRWNNPWKNTKKRYST